MLGNFYRHKVTLYKELGTDRYSNITYDDGVEIRGTLLLHTKLNSYNELEYCKTTNTFLTDYKDLKLGDKINNLHIVDLVEIPNAQGKFHHYVCILSEGH